MWYSSAWSSRFRFYHDQRKLLGFLLLGLLILGLPVTVYVANQQQSSKTLAGASCAAYGGGLELCGERCVPVGSCGTYPGTEEFTPGAETQPAESPNNQDTPSNACSSTPVYPECDCKGDGWVHEVFSCNGSLRAGAPIYQGDGVCAGYAAYAPACGQAVPVQPQQPTTQPRPQPPPQTAAPGCPNREDTANSYSQCGGSAGLAGRDSTHAYEIIPIINCRGERVGTNIRDAGVSETCKAQAPATTAESPAPQATTTPQPPRSPTPEPQRNPTPEAPSEGRARGQACQVAGHQKERCTEGACLPNCGPFSPSRKSCQSCDYFGNECVSHAPVYECQ